MKSKLTQSSTNDQRHDPRRRLLLAGLAVAPFAARGQGTNAYPTRPITIVIPQAPGATADVAMRLISQRIGERLGQPVVIDNRVGAANIIGSDHVAKAAPDGHTLLVYISTLPVHAALRSTMPFNVVNDFAPITKLLTANVVLMVSADVKAKTAQELFALAKANSGKLTYASAGLGSPHHMLGELTKQQLGLNMLHVPHKDQALAVQAVSGGHVDMMIVGLSAVIPLAKAGKVRLLGWTGSRRSPLIPEVPTFRELGYEFLNNTGAWFGLAAPAKTPASVIARLNREFREVLAIPELAADVANRSGADIETSTPEQLQSQIKIELEQWGKLAREGNLKLE